MFSPTLRRKIRILSHEVPNRPAHTPLAEARAHTHAHAHPRTHAHAHVQHSASCSQHGSVVDGRRLLDADRLEEVLGGNALSTAHPGRCHVVRELHTGQRRAFSVGFCGRKRTCAADTARLLRSNRCVRRCTLRCACTLCVVWSQRTRRSCSLRGSPSCRRRHSRPSSRPVPRRTAPHPRLGMGSALTVLHVVHSAGANPGAALRPHFSPPLGSARHGTTPPVTLHRRLSV
jgi:hypothetical protein